ncbi:hypothetical protein R6Q59_022283 [Mikania micrantha]
MRRVRRWDAIEAVTITTAALGFRPTKGCKRVSSDEGMRRVRRWDAIEAVTITTAALGFRLTKGFRRTKECEGFDCGGRRRRRWLEGASAVEGDGSEMGCMNGREKPRRGLKIQEDVEPCLQGKEVSQTFFNEMSARKQTPYIFSWSAGRRQKRFRRRSQTFSQNSHIYCITLGSQIPAVASHTTDDYPLAGAPHRRSSPLWRSSSPILPSPVILTAAPLLAGTFNGRSSPLPRSSPSWYALFDTVKCFA